MLKYSKESIPCSLLGTFHFKGELKARIQESYTEKVHVVNYFQFITGEFSLREDLSQVVNESVNSYIEDVVEDTHVAIVTDEVEEVLSTNRYIQATTPKGKKLVTTEDVLPKFCEQYKLDIEAVKLVLEGVQKTHRKWGFVLSE